MRITITRPVAITGAGGVRSLAPGLTVELDEAAARQLVQQGSAVVREPPVQDVPAAPASAEPAPAPADNEHRSAADAPSKPSAPNATVRKTRPSKPTEEADDVADQPDG